MVQSSHVPFHYNPSSLPAVLRASSHQNSTHNQHQKMVSQISKSSVTGVPNEATQRSTVSASMYKKELNATYSIEAVKPTGNTETQSPHLFYLTYYLSIKEMAMPEQIERVDLRRDFFYSTPSSPAFSKLTVRHIEGLQCRSQPKR